MYKCSVNLVEKTINADEEMSSQARTKERANERYYKQPWLVGCNFMPSSAVNQLEMRQKKTFDPETIHRRQCEKFHKVDTMSFKKAAQIIKAGPGIFKYVYPKGERAC
ncbi:hypothetical protein COY52_12765 [Candidatus Desantisbacteria bacterium CG_4_10_14_0_8_um_filter_48_22]|uniref:Uncharacterized protein n=1 Tax=Candidatus Desantisbacteria bacterium CG_4_10_14_0_8_um_filter_48_22 TaxID=1974543 RepID=A0A2M7S4P3_9BACT|nr:MAG: hypothetical protein AUJ67_06230 [Candidatus Desantisbacteria bacterium CG1_02_49_89]PIV57091.1 MAG: hypothetical protein COS16_01880 [Candidatus Desantisbacteria bacterium CG02_land_8_20_14_3_00_49_13]PIZ14389.1 MAG: hypothetical protein COY52_12765 [Candidatus Desantisbacteria bacterium CG_4_10_14_0_8_um_filter_48_22]PJB27264.1 MAG: hypothetical protein CO111_06165 [Candidatus Desantisbacteria bacterium CG_4_9_14_3_um_filter_50_7]